LNDGWQIGGGEHKFLHEWLEGNLRYRNLRLRSQLTRKKYLDLVTASITAQ
jgi:hypothetical protein